MSSYILAGNLNVINEFERLMSQEALSYIESERNIFYKLTNTQTYKCAVQRLIETKEKEVFHAALHELIEGFSCEQLLALDCVFRLAEYSKGNSKNSALYICYDNLDAIENFDELIKFHNTLIALRRNVDKYIEKIDENFVNLPIPHFVIIATYRKIRCQGLNQHDMLSVVKTMEKIIALCNI